MVQRKMLASMPADVRAEYEAANRRLSQSIKAAEEPETVGYTQANAATVRAAAIANYKGITPTTDTKETKRKVGSGDGRATEFENTADFLGNAIQLSAIGQNRPVIIEIKGPKTSHFKKNKTAPRDREENRFNGACRISSK
jgi:hypothetical protein